jgi:hypothetical protein
MSSISAGTTTTTGYVVSSDTTGSLVLKTGASATTAVTVDTSQRVGVGTTTPAKLLNIASSATTEVWVESTSTQKAILSLSAGDTSVGFTSTYNSGGSAARPFIFYNVSTPLLQFDAGKTVALQGASTATGTGITFPATQSASSDANTLDDYEEGTWTPASSFTGGNGTRTDTVTGKYTKIGDMVYANFDIFITKGTASGNLSVTGLPFARGGQDNRGGGVMFAYINMATLTNGLIAYIGDNQSSFTFFNGPNLANITPAGNLGTTSQFIGTVIYKV